MNRHLKPVIVFEILITLIFTVDALADRAGRTESFKSIVAELISKIDAEMVEEFRKAWVNAHAGASAIEGLVLIFRLEDGSYQARLQHKTNQYKKVTFSWTSDVAAIVHTHPKSSDPRPSSADREIADRCGVPIFTITLHGMYVYDPVTKKISRVMKRLDWLDPSNWGPEVYAKLAEVGS